MEEEKEDPDGDHKISVMAILSAIEFLAVKYTGDQQYAGLVVRELKKGPNNLLECFADLMVDFEAKFRALDPDAKIDPVYRNMFDHIFESWKLNGRSAKFNTDVRAILFDNESMPVYMTDPKDREVLKGVVALFK